MGAMGIAIPGGRFELIDVDGSVITQPGVTGELRYFGDNVTLGYAECAADLGKGDERGGVLETGDMAQMDAEGFYTIVGRKKRFLKLFGNRVNLDETERMLKGRVPGRGMRLRRQGRPVGDFLHQLRKAIRHARLSGGKDGPEPGRIRHAPSALHSQKRRGQDALPGVGKIR